MYGWSVYFVGEFVVVVGWVWLVVDREGYWVVLEVGWGGGFVVGIVVDVVWMGVGMRKGIVLGGIFVYMDLVFGFLRNWFFLVGV